MLHPHVSDMEWTNLALLRPVTKSTSYILLFCTFVLKCLPCVLGPCCVGRTAQPGVEGQGESVHMKCVSCLIKKLRMGMVLLHECVQWINPECCVLTSLLSSGCVGKRLPQETDAAYIVPWAAKCKLVWGW